MRGAREGLLWKVPSETPKRQKVEGTNNRSQRNRAKGVECTVPNTRRAATKKGKKSQKKRPKKKKPQTKTTKKKNQKKTTNFPTLKKIKKNKNNATQVSTKRRPVAWAGLCVCVWCGDATCPSKGENAPLSALRLRTRHAEKQIVKRQSRNRKPEKQLAAAVRKRHAQQKPLQTGSTSVSSPVPPCVRLDVPAVGGVLCVFCTASLIPVCLSGEVLNGNQTTQPNRNPAHCHTPTPTPTPTPTGGCSPSTPIAPAPIPSLDLVDLDEPEAEHEPCPCVAACWPGVKVHELSVLQGCPGAQGMAASEPHYHRCHLLVRLRLSALSCCGSEAGSAATNGTFHQTPYSEQLL